MKLTRNLLLLLFMFSLSFLTAQSQITDSLALNFKTPPAYTKPWVYWYWISDHISKDGITKDLEAMAKVGIGEALIGNIDVIKEKGSVKALTEDWWQMIDHAIREGKRTGVNIGVFNSPGWSQSGGPWNKPENAMRYLNMSEIRVKGPMKFSAKLPQPSSQFQDVAVLAFLAPLNDADFLSSSNSKIRCNPEIKDAGSWFDGNQSTEVFMPNLSSKSVTIDFEQAVDYTVRSITFYPSKTSFNVTCEIQSKESDGTFKTIKIIKIERTNNNTNVGFLPFAPVCETFSATTSKQFRIVFSSIGGKAGFTEIALSGAARTERFVEKQLAKLWPTSAPLWDAYLWKKPAEIDLNTLAVNLQKELNITSKMKSDGTLEWNVPEGEWIIERIGMTPTGQKNTPASKEATGLEIDKMNRKYVAEHFDAYIGQILRRLPESDRSAFKHIVADSYETGAQNWTDGLSADFLKHYGYDPIPWLPVLSGRVVGNADLSERFLWDLRRMIADRISYDYVGGLRESANKNGLKLWLENYGHWGYPGEFLQYGGQSDEIGGEFWTHDDLAGIEPRAASSAAHTYGKNVVHCEAFTSFGPMWKFDPWSLKKRGDWAATQGINHFVLHVYIHQPDTDKIPGINAWFGVEFNRHNTWFFQSKEWIDYLRRTHYLLQQGKYVADVAYFIGEDAPKMTGIRSPQLPEGYNFDYINAEVIEKNLQVKNGRFVLPDGMSYKVLVLPPLTTMRPELIRKIKELVAAGGIIVGNAPVYSPSMQNFPSCDNEVKQIAQEVWQNCDGVSVKMVSYQNGKVFNGVDLKTVFAELNINPDLGNTVPVHSNWIHRSTGDMDIYYISNQTDAVLKMTPEFRIEGRQPELWNPVTKDQRDLPDFKCENGKTIIPLEFGPRESYFIVFRKIAKTKNRSLVNFYRKQTLLNLTGSWKVCFDAKWGAPDSVVFDSLQDWTKRTEVGIKYYSGTARYIKQFDAPKVTKNEKIYLNLGKLNNLAVVRLNGKSLGLVWAEPHLVEITQVLKRKANVLEIEITNTWNNRLVGDMGLPADKWLTSATTAPVANAPLTPSGLIGPVLIQIEDPNKFVETPIITSDKNLIVRPSQATVTITCVTPESKIYYSLNGTEPTKNSVQYRSPFVVNDCVKIKAKAFSNKLKSSDIGLLDIDAYNIEINGWNYEYFEGMWDKVPDFSKEKVIKQGTIGNFDFEKIKCREDYFGVRFSSHLTTTENGEYTFYLSSDDGSKLYIDDILVADNDGCHSVTKATGNVSLLAGTHKIRIDYFDFLNLESLKLEFSLNDSLEKEIPISWLRY